MYFQPSANDEILAAQPAFTARSHPGSPALCPSRSLTASARRRIVLKTIPEHSRTPSAGSLHSLSTEKRRLTYRFAHVIQESCSDHVIKSVRHVTKLSVSGSVLEKTRKQAAVRSNPQKTVFHAAQSALGRLTGKWFTCNCYVNSMLTVSKTEKRLFPNNQINSAAHTATSNNRTEKEKEFHDQ